MKCVSVFQEVYNRDPDGVAFCPYRVCPIGAHSDHQLGKVTGFAVDQGIRMAYRAKKSGIVEIRSLNFATRAQWHINAVPEKPEHDWADYLRGATWALAKRHHLSVGVCGVIEGSLPIGGLSSSAAVIITFLSALCKANGIELGEQELIDTALAAEKEYVGVSVGKLDQSCEVLSKKNSLLYLDTRDNSYELIPDHPNMKPYKIAIFFSGIERTLAGSKYNMRVDECRSAAYALKAFSGMEYGKFQETNLRDVPLEVYLQYKDKLPENWRKRAEHWFSEYDRVQRGAEAWRRGDLEAYGRLSFESGKSSIYSWETGSPELITLYNLMTQTDGIYAGFKGCCMALVDPSFEEHIRTRITEGYLKEFPALKDKFSVHFCESANGVIHL